MEQVEDRFFLLEREIDLHLQELGSSKSFPPPPPEGSSLSCGEQCRTLLSYFRFLSGVLFVNRNLTHTTRCVTQGNRTYKLQKLVYGPRFDVITPKG
ncbi:hypothetical protein CEXT_237171 [Caerostris extrusa]|uniref:Uncharacterized protein n=1 Tax=Caerostris extrusa TaxID=172846 RepID=A0AAV4U107_CAEEX|nr:hypothetical protein CEXT_237171 [Caerostris extrusa]